MGKGNERKRQKQKRAQAGRRRAAEAAREFPDRRATFAHVVAENDGAVEEETFAVVVEPVRLDTKDVVWFQSPHVPPFYLLTAKTYRDQAEPKRIAALKNTTRAADGGLRPLDPAGAFDALEGLAIAVILAAAAIEAHANDMIGRLPEEAMVEIPTRLAGQTVLVMRNKAAMDWLPMSDKLARAAPILHGSESIKGTVAWQKYKRLFRIRNALVHPRREAVNDPLKPSPFGRLMLGEGSDAPEAAAAVIEGVEPNWLPAHVRSQLGL
jgi:hypothetical protein